ncbi:NAD-P-binding protein [Lactarius hatsudake]|nr:NAD-P-binding protein [Lactarius hatsudake]
MDPIQSIVGIDEELPVTRRGDVYPTIDPNEAFANQTYRGKVVFITGASRGIGQAAAITYAKADANVTVVGRSQESLDKTAAAIRAAISEAHVLAYPADVRDPKALEAAVQATLEPFGRLDVLIANAGALSNVNQKLGDKDPERRWNAFEVNIRGVYNTIRTLLSALEKTSGRIVIVSSSLAQLRFLHFKACSQSPRRIRRPWCVGVLNHHPPDSPLEEYPKLTVFALHPGSVKAQMAKEAEDGYPDGMVFDAVQLPAATMLYLTSGRLDWLNGKYMSANWDIAEIERDWKEKVQVGNALVSKLAIPK